MSINTFNSTFYSTVGKEKYVTYGGYLSNLGCLRIQDISWSSIAAGEKFEGCWA